MSNKLISTTQVAASTPFDNSSNGYIATDVQAAIEESNKHLIAGEFSSVASITAGTGADALMTGMTFTPGIIATYLVWFSCDVLCSTAGAATSVSIYVGGVQKTDSLRKIAPFDGGTLSATTARGVVATQGLVTVTATQAIEIRWSASSGTNTNASRTLNYLRIL